MDGATGDRALTRLLWGSMPLAETLGIEVREGTPGRVEATAPWLSTHTTAGGAMHGGHLMALADSVGALCAFLNLPDGATTVTIESKTNFLRSVTSGSVRVTATPIHVGRSTIVVQTDIEHEERLVTRTTQTQAVISQGNREVGET